MGTVVTLSLISHTNVGKTTLARTLLRRDVGEVIDRAHVTDASEAYDLIDADEDRLRLWDTPGFGDTARLVRRLRREKDPLGWFLHQVWDRFTDRPLWCSQEAMRNVREEADVVLYLVNAAESPEEAGYVPLELEAADLDGAAGAAAAQPGRPRTASSYVERWRSFAGSCPLVRDVLSLDAFTRCWVEEGLLLRKVEQVLERPKREAMRRLAAAWNGANLELFGASCGRMADYLWRAACDRESPGRGSSSGGTLGRLGEALKFSAVDKRRAMKALNERLDGATGELMERLIDDSRSDRDQRGERSSRASRISRCAVTAWAWTNEAGRVLGGAISGALGGLAADA